MTVKKTDRKTKTSGAAKKGKPSVTKKKTLPKQTKEVENVGPPVEPATASVGITAAASGGMIFIWEDDPLSAPVKQPIQVPVPTLPTGTLGINIVDIAQPPAELHPIGTSRFRYWVAAEALTRGMQFWKALLPATTKWVTPDGKLNVHLDKGVDLNAYYRRSTSTLEFFHSTVVGKTVFSGESPNVLCHELGHAVLDSIRPQLFHVASVRSGGVSRIIR